MHKDPIIDALHKIRAAHAAEFKYDVAAIVADIQEEQKRSGAKVVTRPPKRIRKLMPLSSKAKCE